MRRGAGGHRGRGIPMVQGHWTGTCVAAGVIGFVASLAACSALQAQDLPEVETTFATGATLRFYGQVNKGVLTFGDGQVIESCGLTDNDNSNTRFGLTYTQDFAERWAYLGIIEIAYAPFSTSTASILQPSPPASAFEFTNANIRKIDNRVSSPDFGSFWFCQADMASNQTAEIALSDTAVIGYSTVADSAGGNCCGVPTGSCPTSRSRMPSQTMTVSLARCACATIRPCRPGSVCARPTAAICCPTAHCCPTRTFTTSPPPMRAKAMTSSFWRRRHIPGKAAIRRFSMDQPRSCTCQRG